MARKLRLRVTIHEFSIIEDNHPALPTIKSNGNWMCGGHLEINGEFRDFSEFLKSNKEWHLDFPLINNNKTTSDA